MEMAICSPLVTPFPVSTASRKQGATVDGTSPHRCHRGADLFCWRIRISAWISGAVDLLGFLATCVVILSIRIGSATNSHTYQSPGVNAVEVRSNRELGTCNESLATILHHSEGEDLEAQVFNYQITRWDESDIEAVAARAMGLCLERRLAIHLQDKTAALSWSPPDGCEAETGRGFWWVTRYKTTVTRSLTYASV